MAKGIGDAVRRHIHQLVGRHNDSQATDRELLQRFITHQDEAAFAALFRRHAAMVLAAGRRVVGNTHDAEDVCQAAFLLLAKKASSQRWQSSVANSLYQTTHLLALKARTAAARRTRREGSVAPRSPSNPLAEITGQELLAALDEELLTLPEPLRAPLVLCYLEGVTRDEAAQRLGCPLATLKNRLERGRHQLQAALLRRGLDLSAVLLGTLSTQQAADAAATSALSRQTTQGALALVAGKSCDEVISSPVRLLLQGGLHPMCGNKLKAALALLLAGLLSTAGALAVSARDDQPTVSPAREAPVPGKDQGTTLRYQFKKGDQLRYVVEMKAETTSDAAGNPRVGMTTRTYDVTWKVTSVDSYGNAGMTLAIDRVRYVEDTGFPGKVYFDSQKNRNPEGVPALARILAPILKAQVGAEFTFNLSPRGEVSAFQVPKKVADAVKNTQGIRSIYSAESFKQLLVCQASVVLPPGPVSKGAGWSEKADVVVAGGHAKLPVTTQATYQGEADRGGKKLEQISLQPTATTVERDPNSGLGPFALKTHEGKGTIFFDSDKGRLVEAEVTQDLYMESSPPGQKEKIVWKVKLTTSTKLAPSK